MQCQLYNEQNAKKKAWKTVLVYTKFNVLVECKDRKTGNVDFSCSCHKLWFMSIVQILRSIDMSQISCVCIITYNRTCAGTLQACVKEIRPGFGGFIELL
jgi:hypothetical protein